MTPPDHLTDRPKAVLFDWDNTLVDNWECIRQALNAALVAFGHAPWTMKETLGRVRQSMRDSFPRLFGDRWKDARDIFYGHYAAIHAEHVRALPGAERAVRALRDRDIYVAVVSNKTGVFLRAEAAVLGWDGLFSRLVGAGDAAADKPAPDPVRLALEPLGLVPGGFPSSDVWFVGDADIDLECAHRTGCAPILIGDAAGPGVAEFPPAFRFADCEALSDLVQRSFAPIST